VQAAVRSGDLDEARVVRWRKLFDENVLNTPRQTGPRGNRTQQKKGR
jgi:ribosome biogenesis GTPase